jgi:ligand-binding sensor domain-containing protein
MYNFKGKTLYLPKPSQILPLLLLLTVPAVLSPQSPHPAFRQYSTGQGLPSPEVYSILQDSLGFMWFATDNGVSRFDGCEFRNFGPSDGLAENVIFYMRLDTRGRVWMQSMSGKLYIAEGDIIKPWEHNQLIERYQKFSYKADGFLVESAGDTVHVAIRNRGVISFAGGRVIDEYRHELPMYFLGLEKNGQAIYTFFYDSRTSKVEAHRKQLNFEKKIRPFYLHSQEGIASFQPAQSPEYHNRIPFHAFCLGPGQHFLQEGNACFYFEAGSLQWQNEISYVPIWASAGENGAIWVGTSASGVRVYQNLSALRRDEIGQNWLPGLSVSHCFKDREGGWWFSTLEQGLFYTSAHAFFVYDEAAGLPNGYVTALASKNERELYLGLRNGEVFQLDLRRHLLEALPELPGEDLVTDLYFDREHGDLWAARNRLCRLSGKTWTLAIYPGWDNLVNIDASRISGTSHNTRLWTSYFGGFLGLGLPGGEVFSIHTGTDQRTFITREDFEGRVWIGRPQGLFEWKDEKLQDRRSLHPAFSLRVEDIAQAPDSALVLATKGGGLVFWKGDRFEQLSSGAGLTADMMECVFVDERGVTWAGTLNGLNRISGSWGKRRVQVFTTHHGLPSNEIYRVAAAGGYIWLATGKGLVRLSEMEADTTSERPVIQLVSADEVSLDLAALALLPYRQNNLSFRFLTLNFRQNGRIPYRYRLDNGGWTRAFSRVANYPDLPAGMHRFEVQSQNEDGVWSESTIYEFRIRPPWWSSWWFRGAVAASILAAGIGFFNYRTRQLRREIDLQRQMTELERSALQAQMNPHFIFNCLNSIQNFILQNQKEEAIEYLGGFARLVRGMLNASVLGKVTLEEELRLLEDYLSLEQLRFNSRFSYEVKAEKGLDVFDEEIPPLLIQPYVENAVLHGMAGRESGGRVEVSFRKGLQGLEVWVEDNGLGLESNKTSPEGAKPHKSVGMSITRRRLELLSAGDQEEVVKLVQLHDPEGNVRGTLVKINIKKQENS